jgi:hypothetical protein
MGEGAYPLAWSDTHLEIIHNAEQAVLTGTGTAVAAPRGEGKTSVMQGVAVSLLARRMIRFPVLAGWKFDDAKKAFRAWLRMLSDSPEFAADYPELTQPFEVSTHATALKGLTWEDSGEGIGAEIDTISKLIILPDSIGAISARSVQGDAKGLHATLYDGTIVRPDLLLLDDAQDAKRAGNPDAVAKTVDVIENVFMGMGGPNKRLTTFCACTVEAKGDVSEHFLDRPGWTSVRTARISSWPDGWSDDDSPVRALWDEWNGIRLDGSTDDNIAFYVQHKDTLTKGMTVSWSERFDPSRGEPDALYSAMWAFYDMGEDVFARMMQNDPLIKEPAVFDLTPEIITSRITNRLQGEPVEDAELVIVSTDLNPSYAFSSAVVGFGAGHRAWVIDYWTYRGVSGHGIVSGNVSLEERSTKVYEALVVLGKDIMSRTVTPSRWYIDASGTDFKTVLNFCKNSPALVGIQAVPCTGRVENNGYKPNGSNSKQVGHWAYRSYDKKTRKRQQLKAGRSLGL